MARHRSAFTLIELLVVIAIIALLVSILMPSLSSARSQAKSAVCLASLKRLATGINIYLSNHRDRFPPFRLKEGKPGSGVTYVNKFGRAKPRWQWFVDSEEVGPVIDPNPFLDEIEGSGSFGDNSEGEKGAGGREMTNKYFLCPAMGGQYAQDVRNGAYGYNYQYLGNSRLTKDGDAWVNFPVNIQRIKTGGQTVLIGDSRGSGRRHGKHSYTLDPPRMAVERGVELFGPGGSDVPSGLDPTLFQYSPAEMRHRGKGNIAFVDGHAAPKTLLELGYELNEDGVPIPIVNPESGTYEASNKLWNGTGQDTLARMHRP